MAHTLQGAQAALNLSERCSLTSFSSRLPLAALHTDSNFSWELPPDSERTCEDLGIGIGHKSCSETLNQLERTGVPADLTTCASLLRLFGNAKALSDGKRMHNYILKSGGKRNTFLGSLLLQMYIKCGALEEAHAWFADMVERNVYSWNFMIGAYATVENGKIACQLYDRMAWEGVFPDKVTFVYVLSACASQATLGKGKQLHIRIISSGFELDIVVGTALVTMYGKSGNLAYARGMFDRMLEHDVVSWNAMITAYAQNGFSKDALRVFNMMQHEGVMPSRATFASVLDACAGQSTINEGKLVHGHITCTELVSDIVVVTALMTMYGKCGSLDDALHLFNGLIERDVIVWNTMIAVCVHCGCFEDALQLSAQMQYEGVLADQVTFVTILDACASQAAPDEGKRMHALVIFRGFELNSVIVTAIVNMYGKCSKPEVAKSIFDRVERRDLILWTAMIGAYAQHDQCREVFYLFKQMQKEGVIPDKISFLSIISACASQANLIEGNYVHQEISRSGFESDVQIANALITMYSKSGSLNSARLIFDKLVQWDVVSWNAIIAAYAQHGQGMETLQMYNQMEQEGVRPDGVTYVSVLSACSHAGLVDEGCVCLTSMRHDHNIVPNAEHYCCVIDLLGRAGRLDEAENLVKTMHFASTSVQWMTLLGACRNQIDVERGQRAATQVFELDPTNASPYVMLYNIYTASGIVDEVEKAIFKACIKKHAGKEWGALFSVQ